MILPYFNLLCFLNCLEEIQVCFLDFVLVTYVFSFPSSLSFFLCLHSHQDVFLPFSGLGSPVYTLCLS